MIKLSKLWEGGLLDGGLGWALDEDGLVIFGGGVGDFWRWWWWWWFRFLIEKVGDGCSSWIVFVVSSESMDKGAT